MSDKKTITFAVMDAPFENARTTTALRLADIAARRGYNINVWAYEGAVFVPSTTQTAHPNKVHGMDAKEFDHPLPHKWVEAIAKTAEDNGGKLEWINCGLCADERGAHETLSFVKRGTPADLVAWAEASDNTLVIATK